MNTDQHTQKSTSKIRDIDFYTLSNSESQFFSAMLKLFIDTLSSRHKLDLNKLSKGDVERFITHVDQSKPEDFVVNDSENTDTTHSLANNTVLLTCKTTVLPILKKALADMNSRSFVRLAFDQKAPETNTQSAADLRARNWGLIGYALQALGVVIFISLFAALGLNYWLKNQVVGTIAESHLKWQRRTFWWSFGFIFAGILTAYINLGYLLIFAGAVLLAARTFWGAIRLFQFRTV